DHEDARRHVATLSPNAREVTRARLPLRRVRGGLCPPAGSDGRGDEDAEAGAGAVRGGLDVDGAAEAGDQVAADGEAEAGAGAGGLGGVERLEDALALLGRHA